MGAQELSIAEIHRAGNVTMDNTASQNKEAEVDKWNWLKTRLVPIVTLLLVIGITVGLFIFNQRYPGKVEQFEAWGYLGAFIICLISNATVILPIPGILLFVPIITSFNPALLGLVGATGGIIGEITGYMAGYSGRGMVKNTRMSKRVEGWMNRWGIWVVFVFSIAPFLPFDVAGLVAGALRYPLWKFLLVAWAGKTIKYIGLLLAAAWGWEALTRMIGG